MAKALPGELVPILECPLSIEPAVDEALAARTRDMVRIVSEGKESPRAAGRYVPTASVQLADGIARSLEGGPVLS